jgi:hypothetical protein
MYKDPRDSDVLLARDPSFSVTIVNFQLHHASDSVKNPLRSHDFTLFYIV